LIDTEGKWRVIELRGADAVRQLAASAPVSLMLQERECVALTPFDCPVAVARSSGSLDVWVPASYLAHFCASLARERLRSAAR
jgi:hypothetical protein